MSAAHVKHRLSVAVIAFCCCSSWLAGLAAAAASGDGGVGVVNLTAIEECLYETDRYKNFIRPHPTRPTLSTNVSTDVMKSPTLSLSPSPSLMLSSPAPLLTVRDAVVEILVNCWLPNAPQLSNTVWNISIQAHHHTLTIDRQAQTLKFNGPVHVAEMYKNDNLQLDVLLNKYLVVISPSALAASASPGGNRRSKQAAAPQLPVLHYKAPSEHERILREALALSPAMNMPRIYMLFTDELIIPQEISQYKRTSVALHANRVQTFAGFINSSHVKCQNRIDAFPFDQMLCLFVFRIEGMALNDSLDVVGEYEPLFLNVVRKRVENVGIHKLIISADYENFYSTFWNTLSDNEEWNTLRTPVLYCTRSLEAVHCAGTLLMGRSWRKYVFSWLMAMNLLALLGIIGLFGPCPRPDRFSFGVTAIMPSAAFLFTLKNEIPLSNSNYPTIGFYNLIIFINCVTATLVSNVWSDNEDDDGEDFAAVAAAAVENSKTGQKPPIVKKKRFFLLEKLKFAEHWLGYNHPRLLVMGFFLSVHFAANIWAGLIWYWAPRDMDFNGSLHGFWQKSLPRFHPDEQRPLRQANFHWAWQCEKKCEPLTPFDSTDIDNF